MIQIQATNNFVIFEDVIVEEPKSEFGLKFAQTTGKDPRWGKVQSVGPGVPDYNGQMIPCDVVPEDVIYVAAHGKEEIMLRQIVELSPVMEELGYTSKDIEDLRSYILDGGKMNTASILDVFGKVNLESLDFTPFGDFVAIEKIDTPDTQGVLLLAESQKKVPAFARVLKLGLGWRTSGGYENTFQCKEGDIIYYLPHATQVVDYNTIGVNKKLHLIKHGNILGVLKKGKTDVR